MGPSRHTEEKKLGGQGEAELRISKGGIRGDQMLRQNGRENKVVRSFHSLQLRQVGGKRLIKEAAKAAEKGKARVASQLTFARILLKPVHQLGQDLGVPTSSPTEKRRSRHRKGSSILDLIQPSSKPPP